MIAIKILKRMMITKICVIVFCFVIITVAYIITDMTVTITAI